MCGYYELVAWGRDDNLRSLVVLVRLGYKGTSCSHPRTFGYLVGSVIGQYCRGEYAGEHGAHRGEVNSIPYERIISQASRCR